MNRRRSCGGRPCRRDLCWGANLCRCRIHRHRCSLWRRSRSYSEWRTNHGAETGFGLLFQGIVHHLVAAEVGPGLVVDVVAVKICLPAARKDSGERRQCGNDNAHRGRHDHERRSPGLEPHAIMKPVGESSVIDNRGALRHVAQDGASVWIETIVAETRIVMLVVRHELFLDLLLVAGLTVYVRWTEKGDKNRGKQEAEQSHCSSS